MPWQRFAMTVVGIAAVFVIGLLGDRFAGPRVGSAGGRDRRRVPEPVAQRLVGDVGVTGRPDRGRRRWSSRSTSIAGRAGGEQSRSGRSPDSARSTRAEIALFAAGFAALAWWRATGHPRRTLMPVLVLGAQRGDRGAMGELQPDPVRAAGAAVHERGQHAARRQLRFRPTSPTSAAGTSCASRRCPRIESEDPSVRDSRATRGRPRLRRRSPRSGAGCRGGPPRAPARSLRTRFAGAASMSGRRRRAGRCGRGSWRGGSSLRWPSSAGSSPAAPRRTRAAPNALVVGGAARGDADHRRALLRSASHPRPGGAGGHHAGGDRHRPRVGPPTAECSWHTRAVTDLLDAKLDVLRRELAALAPVVVAFSGGADSAFLAAVAHRTLGARSHAVTAVSPSLAGAEQEDCAALAGEWGLRWTAVATDEMARAAYRANDVDRCYHCKAELMDVLAPIAAAEGATVVLGVNVDDLGDHRPGQRAATEAGATFPLVTAGPRQGRRAVGVAAARTAHVGQAGRRVPGEPGAVRNGGVGGRALTRRAGRGGLARPRFPPGAGAPLRRHRPHRGRAVRARPPASRSGTRSSPRCAPPAIAT